MRTDAFDGFAKSTAPVKSSVANQLRIDLNPSIRAYHFERIAWLVDWSTGQAFEAYEKKALKVDLIYGDVRFCLVKD